MWIRKNKTYRIQAVADFSMLAKLRNFFIHYGKKAGLTKKQLNDGKLAVDEAVTNIMRHAYGGPNKGQLIMEITKFENHLSVVFKDWGKEFDWASIIDPDLNKYVKIRRKGGLGVWLIKKLTDGVSHSRSDGMNILTINFNFATEAKKAVVVEYFNNIRRRMNISLKFALIGSTLITVIIGGIYLFAKSSQSDLAKRSFVSKGVNAAKNIASNGVEYLIDENFLALVELIQTVKENVDIVHQISIVNSKKQIVADTDRSKLFKKFVLFKGLTPLGKNNISKQQYLDKSGESLLNIAAPIILNKAKFGEVHLVLNMSRINKAEGLADSELKTFFITILVWVIAIISIVFLTSLFIAPIRKLSNAMSLIGVEDNSMTDFGGAISEFSEIGKAFGDMVDRLRISEAQLTDQTRIKKEMQLAKDIQETLLPKEIPETEGFELVGNYRSALEMGGDYYDFFHVDNKSLGLVVGDVSGKGIGAALIMTMVRTAMRTEARGNKRASDVLDKLNKLVAPDIKKGMYITMYYVVLDSEKKTINYASAGHNPMILYRSTEDELYFLNPKGFAVGLQLGDMGMFSKNIKSQQIQLSKGDLLFIYTDGITEAMNSDREEFGEKRLVDYIKMNHHLPLHQFNDGLDREISRFTGDYPQNDDITYIVIRSKDDPEVEYYKKVSRLIELKENSNMLLEKVLEKTEFSEEEYNKIMEQYKKKGLKSFKPKSLITDDSALLSHATLEQSKKIVCIVREHPEYGAQRIKKALNQERFDFEDLSINVINKELKKLKLSTKKRRVHYANRELSDHTVYSDIEKYERRSEEREDK